MGAERTGWALGDQQGGGWGRDRQRCMEEILELRFQGCSGFAKGGRLQSGAKAQRWEKQGLFLELSVGPGGGRGGRGGCQQRAGCKACRPC